MARYLGVGVVVFAVSWAPVLAGQTTGPAGAASGSPAAAVKANPALIEGLAKEMGSTPAQAAGAAGALFGLAKSKLAPEQFSQISRVVPGMNALLGAAPAAAGAPTAAAAVSKLGLSPDKVTKAVPVLTQDV